MTTLIDAARQALEALEYHTQQTRPIAEAERLDQAAKEP